MRRQALVAMAVVGLVLGGAGSVQAASPMTAFSSGLQSHSSLYKIIDGAEGNLWFTDNEAIGKITPSGTITEYSGGLTSGYSPTSLAVGAEGDVWFTADREGFTNNAEGSIGRITPGGTMTIFSSAENQVGDPVSVKEPDDIVLAPGGDLWFTDAPFFGDEAAIGRVTPTGSITEFEMPGYARPAHLVVGPEGNLWFTNYGIAPMRQAIGKITPAGVITEYLLPERAPEDIAVGPDGNLWFTDASGAIGRITPGGTITEYTAGLQAESGPDEIVNGPEGNLWFSDTGRVRGVGKITTSGAITEYGIGGPEVLNPQAMVAGPDGNIWLVNEYSSLDRITPSGQVTTFSFGLEERSLSQIVVGASGHDLWLPANAYGTASSAIVRVSPVGPSGVSPDPTLRVSTTGGGSGAIVSAPGGIDCASCEGSFSAGTPFTLTAAPSPGSTFVGWISSEGEEHPTCAGSSSCTFSLDGDTSLVGEFQPTAAQGNEPSGGGGGSQDTAGQPSASSSTTPSGTSATTPAKPKPKSKGVACRKGFKKQTVRGKAKCVKIEKKRHRR